VASWLITWEHVGDWVKVENKIAAIMNSRLSGETVSKIVELLYVNELDLSTRVAYAKNKKNIHYHAEFHTLGGVPWLDRITCGYQPCLYARLVDDIRIHRDDNGEETLTWKERPKPDLQSLAGPHSDL